MANALFAKGKQNFLDAAIDLVADAIKLVCVDHADDTPVVATDDALDDILSAARVATSVAFTGKSITDGIFDANDVTLPTVTGDPFESLVVFDDTPAAEANKLLFLYVDTATGLPCTPNGGDITVAWDNGANKIFAL